MSITNIQVCVILLAGLENRIKKFGQNGRTLPNREDTECDPKRNNTCTLLIETWKKSRNTHYEKTNHVLNEE